VGLTTADGRSRWNAHSWQPVTRSQDPHLKSGGIFDWTLISRAADEEILALTGEVATGFSLGRSIPGAVEPA